MGRKNKLTDMLYNERIKGINQGILFANIHSFAVTIALNRVLGIGKTRIERVNECVGDILREYELNSDVGVAYCHKKLEEEVERILKRKLEGMDFDRTSALFKKY